MNLLYGIVFVVVLYLLFMHTEKEGFTKEVNNASAVVDNYFTDLQCIDPLLPIARFRQGNTFEYYSLDGSSPMLMKDFGVPSNVKCFKEKSDKSNDPDFNKYLSTTGIRDTTSKSYKLFNDLGNNVYPSYKAINCTPNGLNDPNHICGKLYTALMNNPTYCPKDEFSKNADCTNIQLSRSKASGTNDPINTLLLSDVRNVYAKQKCQSVDCLRKSGPPPSAPPEPSSPVPDKNGNCDLTTVVRGAKTTTKGGDIQCAKAKSDATAYATLMSDYDTKFAKYTNDFNTCLSMCDSTSTNIPNARYCKGANNVMSYIGNSISC